MIWNLSHFSLLHVKISSNWIYTGVQVIAEASLLSITELLCSFRAPLVHIFLALANTFSFLKWIFLCLFLHIYVHIFICICMCVLLNMHVYTYKSIVQCLGPFSLALHIMFWDRISHWDLEPSNNIEFVPMSMYGPPVPTSPLWNQGHAAQCNEK